MELYRIKRTGKRLPMLKGVDEQGELIISPDEGEEIVEIGERLTDEEIAQIATPMQIVKEEK